MNITGSLKIIIAAIMVLSSAPVAVADLKISVKDTFNGVAASEHLFYFKGSRSREESSPTTYIFQCDLRQLIVVDQQRRKYEIYDEQVRRESQPVIERWRAKNEREALKRRRGGVITLTTMVQDTGERREMFGYTARRIKTTQVLETSPDACSQYLERRETDGWYADILYGLSCSPDISGRDPTEEELNYRQAGMGLFAIPDPTNKTSSFALGWLPYRITKTCADEVHIKPGHVARWGFPLIETTTAFAGDLRQPLRTVTREVTALTTGELDAALFEAPPGYRRVKYGSLFK